MPKPPSSAKAPFLWIVAGPNGSGKSSLYDQADIAGWDGAVWIINPDLLTASIVKGESLDTAAANLAAVQRIETWLYASIDVHQTIGVETVLSTPKYQALVDHAHAKGFDVRMIYVLLDSVERQIDRVRIRVISGGHDVPGDKIRSRRTGSFEQLAWFADHVDQLLIYDNSLGAPFLIADKVLHSSMRWLRRPGKTLHAELAAAGLATHLPRRR